MTISINKVAAVAAVALALPLAMTAPAAQAALVSQWNYTVLTGFDDFTEDGRTEGTGVVEENPNAAFGDRATTLSWGEAGGARSSISVEGEVVSPPLLITNGDSVAGSTFTHSNFPIPEDSTSLATASILTQLMLTPVSGPPSETLPDILLGVDFAETDNQAGTCVSNAQSVCDDIFVLENPEDLSQTFEYEDVSYTVLLEILGVITLDDDACLAAGAGIGCQGILTQENQDNFINTRFSIVAAVPEPGTLAMLALGLGCLVAGGIRRSRPMA